MSPTVVVPERSSISAPRSQDSEKSEYVQPLLLVVMLLSQSTNSRTGAICPAMFV